MTTLLSVVLSSHTGVVVGELQSAHRVLAHAESDSGHPRTPSALGGPLHAPLTVMWEYPFFRCVPRVCNTPGGTRACRRRGYHAQRRQRKSQNGNRSTCGWSVWVAVNHLELHAKYSVCGASKSDGWYSVDSKTLMGLSCTLSPILDTSERHPQPVDTYVHPRVARGRTPFSGVYSVGAPMRGAPGTVATGVMDPKEDDTKVRIEIGTHFGEGCVSP